MNALDHSASQCRLSIKYVQSIYFGFLSPQHFMNNFFARNSINNDVLKTDAGDSLVLSVIKSHKLLLWRIAFTFVACDQL